MKRTDIQSIMIIGSGPIVIGQACEFDYSGTQACKALREEGYRIILVNSNPATIMTDPQTADATYIEPLTLEGATKIIAKERPDALLPTLGGQTALNLAMELAGKGVLAEYGVEMIGASPEAIHKAEDRLEFKKAMETIGLRSARSKTAHSFDEAKSVSEQLGFPCVIRPAYTLGGSGGGIAFDYRQFEQIVRDGLRQSPITEVLIEESLLGWKEYEFEVMRDHKDNAIVVCSIENLDPMGIHTGDSITVAPAQTLTDKDYQRLRTASLDILREIGVNTGGSNVQFAINPKDGRMVVIEMNPRVSRSSALASKATGFPIAKFAAKLAIGMSLDEIQNDMTHETPACFEPTIDYVVTKIPRFNFEKFRGTEAVLGTAMKSVGEVMAIGRTFKESLQKALRSSETGRCGLQTSDPGSSLFDLKARLASPHPSRIDELARAFRMGLELKEAAQITGIDPWFLSQIEDLSLSIHELRNNKDEIRLAKEMGYSDRQLAASMDFADELSFRDYRKELGIIPTYKSVDTCAGEFAAHTPYYYSTYEATDEVEVSAKAKVIVLGGGPNRIGQGIEFDYCCVHAAEALGEMGYLSIMVNSNPETVSTDYDRADRLYFEPLTLEDVLNICDKEKPDGVIVQFGGQTPLILAPKLAEVGIKILGTSPDAIDRAESRDRFRDLLNKLGLKQPEGITIVNAEDASLAAETIGYPVVVRPSYVLGGAAMEVCHTEEELLNYIGKAKIVSPDHPILIDCFLENAIELDVDALADGKDCVIAGMMEHIEPCGIHSGDSACTLPPHSLSASMIRQIESATKSLALELGVCGLMNIQYATQGDHLYVIEVNPRGSRTVPFVSKATGLAWAKLATQVIMGKTLAELNLRLPKIGGYAVKEVTLPFKKFPSVDPALGPEMRSTGEVMGYDQDLSLAYFKAAESAGLVLPLEPSQGSVLVFADSVSYNEREALCESYRQLGMRVFRLTDGSVPMISGKVSLVIAIAGYLGTTIRKWALSQDIPIITTLGAAQMAARAIARKRQSSYQVHSLQELALRPKTELEQVDSQRSL